MTALPVQLQAIDEVASERRAEVVLTEIRIAERRHAKTRPRTMSPRDALTALQFEADYVLVCAGNLQNGVVLSGPDLMRLAIACSRIQAIAHEAGCAA